MGFDFLARIRRTSLLATAGVTLFAAVYFSYAAGIAFAAGALWSLANLRLLEAIVTRLTGGARAWRGALSAGVASVALFGVGAALLRWLPVAALAAGFTLPLAVIVLKAASRLLLGSALWERLTRSPWQAAALVLLLVAGAWAGGGALARARAQGQHPVAAAAAPVAAAPAAGGQGARAEAGPKEFDNIIGVIARANAGRPWAKALETFENVIFSLFVALLLCVVAIAASHDFQLIPGPFQNAVESLVEPVYNQVVDILGPKYGPRYVPFLGSLFLYILFMNLFGIVPLMKSPTANLNVTFALAITVFVYVQYTAVRELGLFGWLHHLAGSPRSAIEWGLVPLALPIHVIGELAKPVSLSCRLFGNIFGEDMLLVGFAGLGIALMSALHLGALPFGLPLHFVFLFLALLTSVVQALVFAMLSTIYFLLMLPHDHEHAEEAHSPAH